MLEQWHMRWKCLNSLELLIIPVKWNVICRKMQENRSRFPKSRIWICIASWFYYHYTVIASCTYNCNSNSCMTERMVYVNQLLNYSCYGCPSKAKFPAVCFLSLRVRVGECVRVVLFMRRNVSVCVLAEVPDWLMLVCLSSNYCHQLRIVIWAWPHVIGFDRQWLRQIITNT